MIPTTIPHGATARRIEWFFLPPTVRAAVEARLGSPVAGAESRTSGFTPGLASVLTCADGSRHFVKAASVRAQRMFADAYREEARKLRMLPPEAPAPRLLWVDEVDDWLVLETEYVDARHPRRPWSGADLAAASDMLVAAAEVLTPAPGTGMATFAEDFAHLPGYWDAIGASYADIGHASEAADLAAGFAEVTAGETLVHTDVRDDNLLLCDDGRVLLCDWNWPCVGAAWLDSLFLLFGPRGDGLDVEAHIREHPLLGQVPAEHIDVALAVVTAHFLKCALDPVPPTSPHLRAAQAWQGEVCWQWLAERRGWS